jgi:hypothetical protein
MWPVSTDCAPLNLRLVLGQLRTWIEDVALAGHGAHDPEPTLDLPVHSIASSARGVGKRKAGHVVPALIRNRRGLEGGKRPSGWMAHSVFQRA